MVDTKRRRSLMICSCLTSAFILSAVLLVGSALLLTNYNHKQSHVGLQTIGVVKTTTFQTPCENQCMPDGSETLPRGIVTRTSDLEMRQLWGPSKKKNSKSPMNLLAIAVGLKQKGNVDQIVKKFPPAQFVVMLFHYDGKVDGWKDLEWSSHAIHVSAINQTKWWFAKRFLHPDVVSEYAYIFLWDEDIGVENFRVGRYLSIIKEEGLQISQPAIDPDKSEVHHKITSREKRLKVHRRAINLRGTGRRCYENSTEPPCTGWVEMMAPVFSRASWRCAWYMIQNDLIHAWGLDFQLGYCAQGNRTANIGIIDSEYVVHYGLPTLGGSAVNKTSEVQGQASKHGTSPDKGSMVPSRSHPSDDRDAVRKRSYAELEIFKNRWKKAVREDKCWSNPFQ
ncbi:uncharacterized protein [Coffea arabica]|uniref:Uncharacterized protein n=1 Tax=Coffea arabica TaxID=13443 RepID=A0A6P6URI2_COFAR|nr:uncharacterized protein LOC113712874 [Coffea arabica]